MKLGEILRARKGRPEEASEEQAASVEGAEGSEPAEASQESGREGARWQEEVQGLPLELISASPFQPRGTFSEESLWELASSIEEHGVIQPIVVRPKGRGYELLVGERRWRACKLLGWERIPAVVREVGEAEAAELALIENLQREDLNVLEEAAGYQRLLQEFNLTQEDLARRLGRSQASIANRLRLLKLPEAVREQLERGAISERHARALLTLSTDEDRIDLGREAERKQLTVRALEERIRRRQARQEDGKDAAPQRMIRVYKDVRLFRNSLRELVGQLRSSGLEVQMEEEDGEEAWEVRVRITKGQQG